MKMMKILFFTINKRLQVYQRLSAYVQYVSIHVCKNLIDYIRNYGFSGGENQ